MCQVPRKSEQLHLHVALLPWRKKGGKKKSGATQQDDICVGAAPCLFVFFHGKKKRSREGCLACGARTFVAVVTSRGQWESRQFILSSSHLETAALPEPPLFDTHLYICCRLPFSHLSSPTETSAADTPATERRFQFGCMQNVHIKLHKLLPFFLFAFLPSSL